MSARGSGRPYTTYPSKLEVFGCAPGCSASAAGAVGSIGVTAGAEGGADDEAPATALSGIDALRVAS